MKITINSNNNKNTAQIKFKSTNLKLADNLSRSGKLSYNFIKQRENLSSARFFQDVTTNWVPKVVFARSIADFTEMTFLEYTESALFYFVPMILSSALGKFFGLLSPKTLKSDLKSNILKPTEELLKEKNPSHVIKRATCVKAAIVLGCVAIPAAEYALSFAKNLLTLKVFKKSNFNNIANLNKGDKQVENEKHQDKVRNSAYNHIKKATIVSAASLACGVFLASVGHKSKALLNISRGILRPVEIIANGLEKLGVNTKNARKHLNNYINFDCDIRDGKPALSKGQLVVSTVVGFLGYSSAGKDRGKLDQLEVWTRVPIVVLYTIFGSEAFDWAFKHILHKQNKFPDLIKQKTGSKSIEEIPDSQKLEEIAQKLSKINKTPIEKEFNRLVKEKAIISAIPYGFSLVFMGFLLAGITRLWTQYRFNHTEKNNKKHP